MKFDELKRLSDRLAALLADPQPGLISWVQMLHEVMTQLTEGWNKKAS